jgi:hypothetical protein
MADGKHGEGSAVALKASPSAAAMARGLRGGSNPLEEWTARVKGIEAGFRAWMAQQPIHIEAAVTTAVGAVQGGALGGLMGSLSADGGSPFPMPQPPPNASPEAMASLKQAQVVPPTNLILMICNFFVKLDYLILKLQLRTYLSNPCRVCVRRRKQFTISITY